MFTLKDVTRTCLGATFDIRSRVCVHYLDLNVTVTFASKLNSCGFTSFQAHQWEVRVKHGVIC